MEEMEQFSDLTTKKSHKGLFCGILIVLLLGLIGFGYYYKSKPDVVFKLAVNRAYKGFNAKTLKSKSKVDFDMAFNLKVDGKSEFVDDKVKEVFDVINNMFLKFSLYEDKENNIYKLDLDAEYRNKELINVGAYYENKKVYLNLNDLYDKLIYDEVDLEEYTNKVNKEDVENIVNEYYKALNKALEKGTFATEKVELNGSKVTKNKLIINDSNKDAMLNELMNYLKNSDKFVKAVSKTSGMEESDVKEMLSSEMDIPELGEDIELSVYTKGLMSKVVKVSVGIGGMELMTITKTSDKNYELAMPESLGVDFKCNINEKATNSAEFKCSMGVENVTMAFVMNVKVDEKYKLEKPNLEKAVLYKDISEKDSDSIMEKLTAKEGVKDLVEAFESIMEKYMSSNEGPIEIDPVDEDFEEIG